MANRDIVDGLKPYGPCLRERPYVAQSTIYKGDPLKQNAAGTVEVATAGDALLGVALNYAIAAGEVIVADHPDQEFEAQSDNTDIDAQTDFGLNYNLVFGTASTAYRRSGVEVDADTGASNSNRQVKVLRLLPRIDNALGGFAKVICKINNHQLSAGTGTLGV